MVTQETAPIGGRTSDEEPATGRNYLSIDDIKSSEDLKPVDLHIPQWNGWVKVRAFTVDERRMVRKAAEMKVPSPETGETITEYDNEELELEAIIQGCLEPRFSRADKKWLRSEKSSGAITTISTKILTLSGMAGTSGEAPEDDS